jgi:hypothetical protein
MRLLEGSRHSCALMQAVVFCKMSLSFKHYLSRVQVSSLTEGFDISWPHYRHDRILQGWPTRQVSADATLGGNFDNSHVLIKFSLEQATNSPTVSLTSALDGGWVVNTTPRPIYPREWPGRGGWVGPRAVLDGCWKSRPHRDSIPGPSSP